MKVRKLNRVRPFHAFPALKHRAERAKPADAGCSVCFNQFRVLQRPSLSELGALALGERCGRIHASLPDHFLSLHQVAGTSFSRLTFCGILL